MQCCSATGGVVLTHSDTRRWVIATQPSLSVYIMFPSDRDRIPTDHSISQSQYPATTFVPRETASIALVDVGTDEPRMMTLTDIDTERSNLEVHRVRYRHMKGSVEPQFVTSSEAVVRCFSWANAFLIEMSYFLARNNDL